jgi:hypothetical protein
VSAEEADERDLVADLEEIVSDCGFVHFDVPREGPGSTYVVMIVPHDEQVYRDEDEDEDAGGSGLGYGGEGLDCSCAVRIYAIPDNAVSAERRQVLRRADRADLSRYDEGEVDDAEAAQAALLVESWVGEGDWADRLAFVYNHDPPTYAGPGAPDRPSEVVTIMLPASGFDRVASRY